MSAPENNGFAAFWSRYPRKDAQSRAENLWSRQNPTAEAQADLHLALEVDMQSPKWALQSGRFIPTAHTWLTRHLDFGGALNRPAQPPQADLQSRSVRPQLPSTHPSARLGACQGPEDASSHRSAWALAKGLLQRAGQPAKSKFRQLGDWFSWVTGEGKGAVRENATLASPKSPTTRGDAA